MCINASFLWLQHTHELKVHQISVRVDGWKETSPVSVDKVGIYFRQARPNVDPEATIVRLCILLVHEMTRFKLHFHSRIVPAVKVFVSIWKFVLVFSPHGQYSEQPAARVVFDVSHEGSARKVITVRSALMLHNKLDATIDVKLERTLHTTGKFNESHHSLGSPTMENTDNFCCTRYCCLTF